MKKIRGVREAKDVVKFLKSRGLLKQYRKAKSFILLGNFRLVQLKERQPKGSGVLYFRINKQYRAIGYIDDDMDLMVFEIDDHS